MKFAPISVIAAIASVAFSSVAFAQEPPPMHPGEAHKGWDPAAMHTRMEARQAERAKALHDALNIKPDQEAAFAAFTAAMHPDHDGKPDGKGWSHDHDAMAAMTTPERLDHMQQMMDQRIAKRHEAFERRAGATKALYAVLSPEQKHTFDALAELKGREHGWGKHHGGGPRMG